MDYVNKIFMGVTLSVLGWTAVTLAENKAELARQQENVKWLERVCAYEEANLSGRTRTQNLGSDHAKGKD